MIWKCVAELGTMEAVLEDILLLFFAFVIIALGVGLVLEMPGRQLGGSILLAFGVASLCYFVAKNRKHKGKHGFFGACWCRPVLREVHERSDIGNTEPN